MAATAAAVVAEEDTELRDLLVQTLENSGVLNRIKVGRETGPAGPGGGEAGRACGPWSLCERLASQRDAGCVRLASRAGSGPVGGGGRPRGSRVTPRVTPRETSPRERRPSSGLRAVESPGAPRVPGGGGVPSGSL